MTQSSVNLPPSGTGDTGVKAAVKKLSTGESVQQIELVTAVDGGAATAISSGNPLEVAIVGTVPISGAPTTVTANLGTIGGAATQTTLAAVLSALGTPLQAGGSVAVTSSALPTGAATQTTLASILTNLGSPLQAGGNVAVTSSALPTGAATQTTLASLLAKTPALGTPGTPSNDTITIQGSGSGTPVPVSGTFTANPQSDVASSGALTGASQTIAAGSLNGAATAIFDVSGTFVATLTVQATVDGTNWFAVTGLRDASNTNGSFAAVSTITTTGRYEVPVGGFANVRVNSTAYTSGSAIISLRVSTGATVLPATLAAGSNTVGGVTLPTTTTGGYTISRTLAAASTNATSVKASAGQVFGWYLANAAAYTVFLKLYNKVSAPTVGTDTPILTIPVPAGGGANVEYVRGLPFGTGIAFAITKLVADSDTTVVAANDLVVNLFYA